jgi:hypothetical protein
VLRQIYFFVLSLLPPKSFRVGEVRGTGDIARGRWVLIAMMLGSAIAGLDATAVNIALPTLPDAARSTRERSWPELGVVGCGSVVPPTCLNSPFLHAVQSRSRFAGGNEGRLLKDVAPDLGGV